MDATHQRQTSLPPPYQAYPSYDDSFSPTSSQPYLDSASPTSQDLYQSLPHYAILPAFDSPPNYSRRLRQLIESRRRPTFLSLRIPVRTSSKPQQIIITATDEKSAHLSTNLLGMPCEEDLETYSFAEDKPQKQRRFRRRSSTDDREISWVAFAGMATIIFMMLCSCSIFIAWSTGLFQGMHGLEMMQSHMHTWSEHAETYVLEGEAQVLDFVASSTVVTASRPSSSPQVTPVTISKRERRSRRTLRAKAVKN